MPTQEICTEHRLKITLLEEKINTLGGEMCKLTKSLEDFETKIERQTEDLKAFLATKVYYLCLFLIIIAVFNEKYLPIFTKFLPTP